MRPLRDDLIQRVEAGELTPEEAETEASRSGIGRLAGSPASNQLDPIGEIWWTLPMAVAWIASRSTAAVLHNWDAYRLRSFTWRAYPSNGLEDSEQWKLEPGQQATLSSLKSEADRWGDSYDAWTSIEHSQNALWEALRNGVLQAVGRERKFGTEVHIGAGEWCELSVADEAGQLFVVAPNGHAYDEVKVYSFDVTRLWPPPAERAIFPPTVAPAGPGYMPLYCAAQWIATEGDKRRFVPSDVEVWRKAYSELLACMASEEVKAIGKGRDGMNEAIPGYHFASCRVDYPFNDADFDLILSNDLYLRSTPYFGDAHWRDGYDDALTSMKGDRWQLIQVLKSDVARQWPFDLISETEPPPQRSGAPGRPTSMHLIESEFETRKARGEIARTIAQEARILSEWLRLKHSSQPQLTPKTIENNLRKKFRAAFPPT